MTTKKLTEYDPTHITMPARRARTRLNKWQPKFLAVLRQMPVLAYAAKCAGVSTSTVNELRRNDPEFATAVEQALLDGGEIALEVSAMERATKGWWEPVYKDGKKVGKVWRWSEKLMALLLRYNLPRKYNPPDTMRHVGPADGPVEHHHTLDVTKLTDQELDDLIARKSLPAPSPSTPEPAGGAGAAPPGPGADIAHHGAGAAEGGGGPNGAGQAS
jgi:hypothetical protein